MKRTKQIIGILLIVFSVAALVYWEADGRNRMMTEKVLIATENIAKGELITGQMLGPVSAMPQTLIDGAFKPEEAYKAVGKEASQDIAKNQQISGRLLLEPSVAIKNKLSPYLIKADWIDSRSSSLRKGDTIDIYSRDGGFYLGEFEVIFVKDVNDKEIVDIIDDDTGFAKQGRQGGGIGGRTHASGVIDHLEILTGLDEYKKILKFVDTAGEQLLIVQKGDEL